MNDYKLTYYLVIMIKKKILIAQGGGPTMVINKSLVGIIQQAKDKFQVLGSLNGVRGIVDNKFTSLNELSSQKMNEIENSPGAALGSTRDKPDQKYCDEICKVLKKKKIEKFFYIGGNDSSDSLRLISEKAKKDGQNIQCIHVPKTIDNDLVLNDHTPGFGSAAKYVSSLFAGINLDVNSLPGIYIGVVMGRHAGFLTASSALLRKRKSDGPHLIYVPESIFNISKFSNDVLKVYNKYGKCVVAISEGIKNNKGQLLATLANNSNEKDAHGNVQLSGSGSLGDFLSNGIKKTLNIKRVRSDTLGYPQRSFLGCCSEVDQKEAKLIGKKAVQFSLKTTESFSVSIKERSSFSSGYDIKFSINNLKDIAGKTKYMSPKFINNQGNNVTSQFINYALPLIGKKFPKFTTNL
jgi:ATP-dependent phosphofructokinase / diphosphate-dependent phosphofructokinase